MSRKEHIEELTRQHQQASSSKASSPAEPEPSEKPELDLDDPVTQERIINPDGTPVELSYGKITLYPPSAMVRRLAYSFCQEILVDAAETRPSTKELFTIRVVSKLMESAAPQLRLFRLVASMCGKPGKIDDKTALELSTEIAESASPDDVAILFERLSVAAGLNVGVGAAKK